MLLQFLGKLKIQIFCRYSADMEESANKLHLCTDINSSTRVAVYTKCIHVLTEYLKYQAYEGMAIFFSLHSLPLPGRLSTVPVSCNFFNSLLTSCFVQLFSRNSSVNLFAVYPFKYKLFIKILFSSFNIMLTAGKHCSDVCCDEFPMPQIDRKSK